MYPSLLRCFRMKESLVKAQFTFLEKFAKENGIREPKEWGKVTLAQVIRSGGRTFLQDYSYSLKRLLKSSYPSIHQLIF